MAPQPDYRRIESLLVNAFRDMDTGVLDEDSETGDKFCAQINITELAKYLAKELDR